MHWVIIMQIEQGTATIYQSFIGVYQGNNQLHGRSVRYPGEKQNLNNRKNLQPPVQFSSILVGFCALNEWTISPRFQLNRPKIRQLLECTRL